MKETNAKKNPSASHARNYSIIALIFALLACIATFFLGITRGLVSMQVFTGMEAEDVNRYLMVSAGLIILGLAAYAILALVMKHTVFGRHVNLVGANPEAAHVLGISVTWNRIQAIP